METLQYILKEKDGVIAILFVILASLLCISVLTHKFITWARQKWSLEGRTRRHREKAIQFLRVSLRANIENKPKQLQITREIKKELI